MTNKKSKKLFAGIVCLAVFVALIFGQVQVVRAGENGDGSGPDTTATSTLNSDSGEVIRDTNKLFRKKHKEKVKNTDSIVDADKRSFFQKLFGIHPKKKNDATNTSGLTNGQAVQPDGTTTGADGQPISLATGLPEQAAARSNENSGSSDGNRLFRKKHPSRNKASDSDTHQIDTPVSKTTSNTTSNDELFKIKISMHNKSAKQIKNIIGRYVSDAKDYYIEGDLVNSLRNIDKAIQLDPQNAEAMSFKKKILLVRDKMADTRRDISEQYYYEGAFYLEKGNPLDSLLLITKAVKLNPQSDKAKTLLTTIQEMNRNMIASMGKKDGKTLEKAINCFVNEDFEKSSKLFRKLQFYYPDTANFLSFALVHCSDKANARRAQEYVDMAVDDIRHERYIKAKEDLFMALEMERGNMDAKVIFEQVKIELNLSAQSPSDIFNTPAKVPEQLQ